MTIECIRCGKTFQYNKIFINHLIKAEKCTEKYISISKKYYKNNYKEVNNLFEHNYPHVKEQNEGIKYGCEQCGELYNSKSYYYRHKKHHCNKNEQLNVQDNKITANNEVSSNNQNMINSNYQNMTHSQNLNIGNNNSTITINNYGTPFDVTQLPVNIKKNIISNPLEAITKMCDTFYIYIPENRNVYIKDYKDGYGMIYKDGIWSKVPMNTLISEIVENSADYVTDICEDNTFKKSNISVNKINKHFDNICNDIQVANTEKNNVKCLLDNNSHIIKNNYELLIKNSVKLNLKPILS